jgi:hypothetical protein
MANSDDSKFRSDVDILTFRYLRPTTVGNMGDWQRQWWV